MVESVELKAIVCVLVILVGVSAVMPAIATSVDGSTEQRQTHTQTEGEQVTLTGGLKAYPNTIVGGSNARVNVTIIDVDAGTDAVTGEIDNGNSATVAVNGVNMTVTIADVPSSEEAIITYEYPLSLGLPDGASVILGNTTLMLMLIITMAIMSLMLAILTGFFEG